MKQPENSIEVCETLDGIHVVCVCDGLNSDADIAKGRTRKSALEAADRRLERLKCDVARDLELLERDNG